MNYLSVCSGVEAASQAWEPLGWRPVAFSEIEPFPCAVLASRFPDVPNLGDMSRIHYDYERKELYNDTTRLLCRDGIDLLVGGTPCQSFSIAGKREGLDGASGLAYHYARLIGEIRPRWFVWENVPGALSSVTECDQRDFNFLLHAFSVGGDAALGLRWDCCWRILDTQFVRVERYPLAIPQRRRRLFVVGHLATDGGCGCEVLLERAGLFGDTPPRRVKGQGIAQDAGRRAQGADGAVGEDSYNQTVSNECAKTIASAAATDKDHIGSVAIRSTVGVNCQGGANASITDERTDTITAASNSSGNNVQGVCISFKAGQSANGGLGVDEGARQTMGGHMSGWEPTVALGVKFGEMVRLSNHEQLNDEVLPTLSKSDGKAGDNTPSVAIGIGRDAFNSGANAQMAQSVSTEVQPPITARGTGGVCVNGVP